MYELVRVGHAILIGELLGRKEILPQFKVMQKVFALLLAEFHKLGATIVFANFSKIIIDTNQEIYLSGLSLSLCTSGILYSLWISTVRRDAPPGQKVGLIAAKRTGRLRCTATA